jgi:predicted transcriptional regulator
MATTIQVSEALQQKLNEKRLFVKETYEEVIWNLIEDTEELSAETKKEIAEARAEIAKGNFVTFEEFKKRYNV